MGCKVWNASCKNWKDEAQHVKLCNSDVKFGALKKESQRLCMVKFFKDCYNNRVIGNCETQI